MTHPLDRYAPFTDLDALKEICAIPPRKSVRVNTLKSNVDDFRKWTEKKGWELAPVQWCGEGFFVKQLGTSPLDPHFDLRSHATRGDVHSLGRDLMHQLGHTYMQEAASMLPVELLDPQPGEMILDMCAAPGSKTTQMAAKMKNTGVILANDMQTKRLWTLQQALQRCGVLNTITTNRRGEWFGKNMTEQFDRVLCDAPCSAQGVVRSDPSALKYSDDRRVKKLAHTQELLLESAIHAAKAGGRIVYSTCTLTPEENEEVVIKLLKKYEGKIEVQDIQLDMNNAIQNSQKMQSNTQHSFLRLWPHTYNTEGFFCAILQKTASTCDQIQQQPIPFRHESLKANQLREYTSILDHLFGTSFISESETVLKNADALYVTTIDAAKCDLPTKIESIGIPFIKGIRDSKTIRLTHEMATYRGNQAKTNIENLSDAQLSDLLDGKDTPCDPAIRGDHVLLWNNLGIGNGRAKEGVMKNWLPRWLISQVTIRE